jgi:hypothetical protein
MVHLTAALIAADSPGPSPHAEPPGTAFGVGAGELA